MSRDDTGQRLLVELRGRELDCSMLPVLEDVDDFATATLVAGTIPDTDFASAVRAITARLTSTVGSAR
jgi:hypothetical protein